jgi:glycerol-1-phosphate dehydrogenase [NAD(P)+]
MSNIIDTALTTATDTRAIVIARDVAASAGTLLRRHFGHDRTVQVVADENTFAAAGKAVDAALRSAGLTVLAPLVFPGRPLMSADVGHAMGIVEQLPHHNVTLVAVGGGTINDLTKFAAHHINQPYAAVATAASMDGYASAGAPLLRDGFKITIQCTAPRLILADPAVLAAAPRYLVAAGYGDMAGKWVAGADWMIADALGVEPIDSAVWGLLQPHLDRWLADPAGLAAGDGNAMAVLLEGLIVSGLAMQAMSSSRPASGSEHQVAHLWEMQDVHWRGEHVPHGLAVGLGALALGALYEALLDYDLSRLDVEAAVASYPDTAGLERAVRAAIPQAGIQARALEETLAKHLTPAALRERLSRLQSCWPSLRLRLRAQLPPVAEVRHRLAAAGCPLDLAAFGLTADNVRAACRAAAFIRRRYTVLDLAVETNLLTSLLDRVVTAFES